MKIFDRFIIDGIVDLPSCLTQEEFEILFFNWLEENGFFYGGSIKGFEDEE